MTPAFLVLAGAGLLAAVGLARWAPKGWLVATLVAAGSALVAATRVLVGGPVWEWIGPVVLAGQRPHLVLDAVSAWFLALLALLGGAGAVYSRTYWADAAHPVSAPAGRAWWNALLLCMALVLLCANGLHFLIAWELFAVCAFFLITLQRSRVEVRKAGWLYLGASHAGTLCLFAFFAGVAAETGSWELGGLAERVELAPWFWLALVGFGLKAGLFPLHIWLPASHANAPSHVSAILSGVAIKMGIYGLVRASSWIPAPSGAGWVVAVLGAVSAVLGVAFALGQHDLKRLLAYHSVENIGIILVGLGFAMLARSAGEAAWGQMALGGALLHVWNHGIFKALLFFGAGSVLHATGTREMSRLGGLWRAMPWTAGLFALGAAAISGLPPLNGLVSEWLVYLGLFEVVQGRSAAAWLAIPGAICLAMTGALALACFVKVVGIVFLGLPRTEVAKAAHESPASMLAPMGLLGALCLLIGIAPAWLWPALARTISSWAPDWVVGVAPAPLSALGLGNATVAVLGLAAAVLLWRKVQRNGWTREVTWDCGYAAPTPRMQYTAGSFAGTITEWFAWILRPEKEARLPQGLFPAGASSMEHTPETVLERVVEPAGRGLMRVSKHVRRLQHGRIQSYILYLALGALVLGFIIFYGGAR